MTSHEISSFDTIPQTSTLKKEMGPIVSKSRESDPRADAFLRCRQVFWNDTENYPVQDMETFFDFLKTQEKGADCYKVLATCSDEILRKLVDPKEWFDGICNIAWVNQILKQAKTDEKKEVADEKKEVADEKKKKVETKQKTLSDIRLILNDNNHKYLSKEYLDVINNDKIPPSSPEFKNAVKSILAELKVQAQKSGDFQEYRSFVEQFHSIGAVSDAEFAAFKKELDGFLSNSREGGKDSKSNTSDTIGKDLRNHEYEKIGDAYIRFGRLGEKTDEIVRIDEKSGDATKRIVSGTSGYSREVALPKNPATERIRKEGEINERLSDIGNKLAKIAEYKEERKKLENMPETDRSEKDTARLKELESIGDAEQKLVAEKTDLEWEKKHLPKPDANLQETQAQKEKNARDIIGFVDDMGIYALGSTENINTFFRIVGEKAKNGGLAIDPTKGFDNNEKSFIKKEFTRLIGNEDIFKPDPDFTRQENMQDIASVREKLIVAHKGVFRNEPPYITPNGIELLVQWGQTATKNTL